MYKDFYFEAVEELDTQPEDPETHALRAALSKTMGEDTIQEQLTYTLKSGHGVVLMPVLRESKPDQWDWMVYRLSNDAVKEFAP